MPDRRAWFCDNTKKMPGKNRPRKRRYQRKPSDTVNIAKEHIALLLDKAKQRSKDNMPLTNRYITLARKIAMKFKIRLTSEQKRLFCPHCYKFMLPGKTSRVRIHEHRIIYYCLTCKRFWRRPLKGKKDHKPARSSG
jgi:ribonuclease P protein subunit RPR2